MTKRRINRTRQPITVSILPAGVINAPANWIKTIAPDAESAFNQAKDSVMFQDCQKAHVLEGNKFRGVFRSGIDYTDPNRSQPLTK